MVCRCGEEASTMLRSLLVPLDGSELAEQNVRFAARLATDGNSRLVLVHVRTPSADTGAREYDLAAVAERVRADSVPAEVRVLDVDDHDVGRAICVAAREESVDLIVMSTHGFGGRSHRYLGDVAHQILGAVESPILLVPAACRHPWPQDRPLRVLVRPDDAEIAEQILRSAAEL